MGITGLLPLLSEYASRQHISTFRGEKVAIDAYAWLHRAAFTCPAELARGEYTHGYLKFVMYLTGLLTHYGVQPIVVFDGAPLPAKALENKSRSDGRTDAKLLGDKLWSAGKTEEAKRSYQSAVRVSSAMTQNWMRALRAEKIQFIVAPYEADAQMAYLYHTGQVAACITEDSDLIVHGCKIFMKLTRDGDGLVLDLRGAIKAKTAATAAAAAAAAATAAAATTNGDSKGSPPPAAAASPLPDASSVPTETSESAAASELQSADTWSADEPVTAAAPVVDGGSASATPTAAAPKKDKNALFLKQINKLSPVHFIDLCVLSGCDYVAGLQRVGLKTAASLLAKYGTTQKVLNEIKRKYAKTVPPDYVNDFMRARLTFLHQTVYDPKHAKFTHLNPLPPAIAAFLKANSALGSTPQTPIRIGSTAGAGGGGGENDKENAAPAPNGASNGAARAASTPAAAPAAAVTSVKRASTSGQYTTTADGAISFKRTPTTPKTPSAAASAAGSSSSSAAASSTAAAAAAAGAFPFDDDKSISVAGVTITDFDFLGPPLPQNLAFDIANGLINPKTQKPYAAPPKHLLVDIEGKNRWILHAYASRFGGGGDGNRHATGGGDLELSQPKASGSGGGGSSVPNSWKRKSFSGLSRPPTAAAAVALTPAQAALMAANKRVKPNTFVPPPVYSSTDLADLSDILSDAHAHTGVAVAAAATAEADIEDGPASDHPEPPAAAAAAAAGAAADFDDGGAGESMDAMFEADERARQEIEAEEWRSANSNNSSASSGPEESPPPLSAASPAAAAAAGVRTSSLASTQVLAPASAAAAAGGVINLIDDDDSDSTPLPPATTKPLASAHPTHVSTLARTLAAARPQSTPPKPPQLSQPSQLSQPARAKYIPPTFGELARERKSTLSLPAAAAVAAPTVTLTPGVRKPGLRRPPAPAAASALPSTSNKNPFKKQ